MWKQRGSSRETGIEIGAWELVCGLSMRLSVGRDWLIKLSESLEVKLIGVSLAVNFGHDVLVVIVSQRSAKLVVVHVRLVLALAPLSGDFVRIYEFEFAVGTFPSDASRVLGVRQKFEEELP